MFIFSDIMKKRYLWDWEHETMHCSNYYLLQIGDRVSDFKLMSWLHPSNNTKASYPECELKAVLIIMFYLEMRRILLMWMGQISLTNPKSEPLYLNFILVPSAVPHNLPLILCAPCCHNNIKFVINWLRK